MSERYMTLAQCAEYIGVAPTTIRWWRTYSPEKVPPYKVIAKGVYEKLRFDKEEIDKWISSKTANRREEQ